MNVPYYIFLIIYLLGVAIFLLWSFFNVYHLVKFGFFDFTGKLNGFIFLGFTTAVLVVTLLLLQDIPWFDTFQLFDLPSQLGDILSPTSSSGI